MPASELPETVDLPPADNDATMRVADAIGGRRSVRAFLDEPIALKALGQILWACQGVTSEDGLRAAPSAGALHPLAVYAVAGRVDGLAAGAWWYDPAGHRLRLQGPGDRRGDLAHAAMRQHWLRDSATILVMAADCSRVVHKYGSRGEQYVNQEVGAAAENAWLQARALGLDAAMVGAFVDSEVGGLVGLPAEERPVLLLGIGQGAPTAPQDVPRVA